MLNIFLHKTEFGFGSETESPLYIAAEQTDNFTGTLVGFYVLELNCS